MEGWSREILTFRSSSPNSPLQNAWKSRFRMSRRQNPPGGKCSSWSSDADLGTQAFRLQGPAGIRQGGLRRPRGVQGGREERQGAVDAGVESRNSSLLIIWLLQLPPMGSV